MCIYLKNNRLYIVKKPFIVFKLSYNTDSSLFISPFMDFLYRVNEKYNSTIEIQDINHKELNGFRSFLCKRDNYLYKTFSGFYSYIPDVKYSVDYNMFIREFYITFGNNRINKQSYDRLNRLAIAAFVVPEDSTYTIEDGVCLSDSLVYTGKFIYPFKNGFDIDIIKDFLKDIKNLNLDKYVSISQRR